MERFEKGRLEVAEVHDMRDFIICVFGVYVSIIDSGRSGEYISTRRKDNTLN